MVNQEICSQFFYEYKGESMSSDDTMSERPFCRLSPHTFSAKSHFLKATIKTLTHLISALYHKPSYQHVH